MCIWIGFFLFTFGSKTEKSLNNQNLVVHMTSLAPPFSKCQFNQIQPTNNKHIKILTKPRCLLTVLVYIWVVEYYSAI